MDIEKKTTRVSFHNLLVISSTLLFITACGGGNNSSTGTSVTPAAPVTSKIGVFLDSPVGNIDYTTKTGSGVITRDKFQTNAKGEYAYTEGENITFSIGSLEFPPVKAAGVVTPLDIAGTNNPNDTKAVNMLRLLQTLDKDGDLGNGIEIDPQAKITASQVAASNPGVDVFSLPESEFVTTVDPLVKDGGQTEAVTELVSTEKAVAHVQETLEDNNITFDPVDSMAPVIKLNGENSVTVTEGETYTDAGATATDNVDGTVAVTTDNPVDTSKVATYTVTYTAKDAADNNATAVTRTVNVIAKVIPDTTAPVIKLNGESSVTITEGETYTDAGATATDNVDGTVAVTTDNPVDTSKVATYTVTYTAKDAADNNATAVTRTVNVIAKVIPDTTAPVIKLNGESSVTITEGETYTDAGATATDNVDGTVAVTTDNPVDTSKVATYTVTYTAKDAADNNATAVTRTVNVIAKVIPDTTAPVIKLNGESSVTITEGETYTDAGATATDNVDGTVAVTTDNPVDTSKVATYTVTYTAKDAADNNATAVTRTVNVIAANKLPIAEAGEDQVIQEGNSITLNGSATDEDGTIESYSWLQSGTEIGNTAELIIPNLTIGEYTFTLLVADDKAGESSDTIDVIVSNNCPEIDNPLQIDTDGDGNGDACDNDDDNDGFKDDDDPAPLDPLIPGDFSTPEAILNNSLLKNALDSAKSQGVDIRTETGLTPPDLTGYYVQDDLTNVVVATSDNTDIGALVFPEESRLTSREGNFIDKAGVAFYNNTAAAFIVGIGSIVRGDGNDFTIYSRSKGTCTLDGSDFSIFFITIASGTLDPSSGDILNQTGLEVTLDTAGALTTSCSNIIIGEQEKVGGWAVSTFDIQRRSDATNLQYMCVDESKAYAPTETWTHSGGTSCSCTNEYTVSCQ